MSILDPRVWLVVAVAIAAAFAAGYWRGERSGKADVLAEWNAERAVLQQQARARDAEHRKVEQRRQSLAMEAVNASRTRETTLRRDAAGARDQLGGLRDELAAERAARGDLPGGACKAERQRIAALEDVFEQCAGRYSGLAEKADRHVNDTLTFDQAWPPP